MEGSQEGPSVHVGLARTGGQQPQMLSRVAGSEVVQVFPPSLPVVGSVPSPHSFGAM